MPTEQLCGRCGAKLAGFTTEGLCSACLLEQGLSKQAHVEPALRQFGNYELIEEIARGGMGVVYKARQVGLERFVAVKMILSGQFASPAEMQRFRAEARAAAGLQHPGIVAIHEVGEHEGLLFFSMDLIEGRNLAQLLRDGPWSASRGAQCIHDVAKAIHYAHERGVLHRDLKPSNVIIGPDSKPRVTDFGLAKRLSSSELDAPASELTTSGQVLGSPSFMPPEQAGGETRELTPAADVYSLGALLYQLVTGRPPFLADTIAATLRLVCENDPVPPRLLAPGVPRDLETLCLKCLEKDPHRRYATALELSDELGRFLQDEPILARSVSQGEKLWRWCRRNPALATSIAVGASLLLIIAIGSPIAAFRIDRGRRQAEAGQSQAKLEAAKSQQVAQFLKDMLKGVGPSAALGRDTKMLREILDKTAERISHDLADQPAVEAELRITIGLVYTELGEYKQAEAMQRRALELRRKLFGDQHLDVARALNRLVAALENQERYAEAEPLAREALAIQRQLLGQENVEVAWSLNSLGVQLRGQGKNTEAELLCREGLAMRRKLLGNVHRDVAISLANLGGYMDTKPTEAEAIFREVLAILKKLFGDSHPDMEITLDNLANVLMDQGKLEEAETVARQALSVQQKMLGADHPHLGRTLSILTDIFKRQNNLVEMEVVMRMALDYRKKTGAYGGPNTFDTIYKVFAAIQARQKPEEAEAFIREELANLEKIRGPDDLDRAHLMMVLAYQLVPRGKLEESELLSREALAIQRKLASNDLALLTSTLGGLCGTLERSRKWKDEEPLLREMLAMQEQLWSPDDRRVARTLGWLSRVVERLGQQEEAERLVRKQLLIQTQFYGKEHTNVVDTTERLSRLLDRAGKLDEVESLKRDLLAVRRRVLGNDHLEVANALSVLVALLRRQDKLEDAEQMMRECLAIRENKMPGEWRTFKTQSVLGIILFDQKKYSDAEPLLVASCAGMAQGANQASSSDAKQYQEALLSLARLYETTERPAQGAEWRQKLADFDTATKTIPPSPAESSP